MLNLMDFPKAGGKPRTSTSFATGEDGLKNRWSVGCILTQDIGNKAYRIMRVECVTYIFVEWGAILETILHSQKVLASSWSIYYAL